MIKKNKEVFEFINFRRSLKKILNIEFDYQILVCLKLKKNYYQKINKSCPHFLKFLQLEYLKKKIFVS